MAASAVVISSATSRLNYSARIVRGKNGQDSRCLLPAGQYLNISCGLWLDGRRMESSIVMNLPVHRVIVSMLYMITVTPCIELSTVFVQDTAVQL